MRERLKKLGNLFDAAIGELELPLAVFPVLVTCMVAVGFIFKQPCTIMEWWLSVSLIVGMLLIRKRGDGDRRIPICTAILFLMVLAFLWLLTNLLTTNGWDDTLAYHQPAVRMLATGWNPVWQNTPEGIATAAGIPPDCCNVWHIVSMPKGVWYFCAAAYQFTNAHFNVLFPLMPLLCCSVAYAIFDAFRAFGKVVAICAVSATFVFVSVSHDSIVDCVVAISAIGLLVTMASYLKTGQWCWTRLIVFSFWMMVSKQPSLLHCFLFWIVFCLAIYIQKNILHLQRMFLAGSMLLMLFGIVCTAPYVTSFVNYGSPFYPRYSGDEEKYPTRNITGDFFERNEDAEVMGHLGAYINAFISHDAAAMYYSHKTGRANFCPVNRAWGAGDASHSRGAPTSAMFRFLYCVSVLLLCFLGKGAGRFYSACLIVGAMAMPTEMIGYSRYTPWVLSGCGFAIVLALNELRQKGMRRSVLTITAITFTAILAGRLLMSSAVRIDQSYAIRVSLKDKPPDVMISSFQDFSGEYAHGQKAVSANLVLLRRSVPALNKSKLVVNPEGVVESPQRCKFYFDYSFKVPCTYDINQYSILRGLVTVNDRTRRLKSYPMFVVRSFFVTLPKSILEVFRG